MSTERNPRIVDIMDKYNVDKEIAELLFSLQEEENENERKN